MAGASGKQPGSSGDDVGLRGFGDGLDAFARAIIADGRQVLTSQELSDAEAVHAIRRALKRWRALMRLLVHPLGEEAEQMRIQARDLMRVLSGARDAQSALDALADLSKTAAAATPPFSATSLATIEKRLTAIRDAAEQLSFTQEMRDRLAQYLDLATQALDRWPLRQIEFDTIADGLVDTYRRARQLMPDDWIEADPDYLHDLRRRVVEHRHQMDLAEPLWPRLGQVWADEAQRLRGRLGACQDLAMLINFTGPHQPVAPWRSKLAPIIAARRTAHLKAAERLAGRLFAEKPKAFRKRLAALWKARQTSNSV
jgi:CHAD domain-containing protein